MLTARRPIRGRLPRLFRRCFTVSIDACRRVHRSHQIGIRATRLQLPPARISGKSPWSAWVSCRILPTAASYCFNRLTKPGGYLTTALDRRNFHGSPVLRIAEPLALDILHLREHSVIGSGIVSAFRAFYSEARNAIPAMRGVSNKEEVHRTNPPYGRLPASSTEISRVLTRR